MMAVFLLIKAKRAQIGEVRHRKNGPHKKVGPNKWLPVKKVGGKWVLKKKQPKKRLVKKITKKETKKSSEELGSLKVVKLSDIRAVEQQRKKFDIEETKGLAISIHKDGLLQSPVVRPDPKNPGKYIIISGERRFRAMKMLEKMGKLPTHKDSLVRDDNVTVKVTTTDDPETVSRIQFIENIQREQLTTMETAKAIKEQVDKYDKTFAELAVAAGKKPGWIADHYKLTKLDPKISHLLEKNAINKSHGLILSSMPAPEQLKWAKKTLHGNWSAKHLAREIRIQEAKKKEQAFFTEEEGMTKEQLSAHEKLKELNKDPDKLRTKFQKFFERQVAFIKTFLDEDEVGLSALGLAATGHLDISLSHLQTIQDSIVEVMEKMKHKRYTLAAPTIFAKSAKPVTIEEIKRKHAFIKLIKMFETLKNLSKAKRRSYYGNLLIIKGS